MSAASAERDPAKEYVSLTQNFADRLWRYPACHAVVHRFIATPLTPNHVTAGHTLVAFASAALLYRDDPRLSFLAGALLEFRAVADCFDGVLARAKKLSSPYGRALDQLGDTLGFSAVMLVAALISTRHHGPVLGWGVVLALSLLSAIATTCWDFYRRRFISLLENGRDEVEDEYVQLARHLSQKPSVALRWSWFVSNFQLVFFSPSAIPRLRARIDAGDTGEVAEGAAPTPIARSLRARVAAGDPELRRAVTSVGFTGADAVFLIVAASAFVNDLFLGCALGCVYAVVTTVRTASVCNRALSETSAAQGLQA
ncbi:MAG: CDP-alcohol phosphatidyltransferase family protein [Polyangiales bacterium]